MTKDEFIAAGVWLYGRHGWKTEMARRLGKHRNTVQRYATGEYAVPITVELSLAQLKAEKMNA